MMNPASTAVKSLAGTLIGDHFGERNGELVVGGVAVSELASTYGTPLYAYDGAAMRANYRRLAQTVSGFAEVYYSIKANPNVDIVRIFVSEGAGLEVASGAELECGLKAGCDPQRILFAGPGKSVSELYLAIRSRIGEIHLESFEEIAHVGRIAEELACSVRVAIRINPVASARGGAMQMGGRPAPFGFDQEDLDQVLRCVAAHKGLHLCGIHLFSGTQILDVDVLKAQWAHAIGLASDVAATLARPLETIDLGGGLGIPYYSGETALDLDRVSDFVPELRAAIQKQPLLRGARVVIEPGRFLVGTAGVYLMSVRAAKTSRATHFVVCDGGMHHHLAASGNLGQIVKRDYPIVPASRMRDEVRNSCHVVGPLCTPLDTLGRSIQLPTMHEGDLIAILQSGAYGLTASPLGFLSHPSPAEVLIEGGTHRSIGQRQVASAVS